VLKHRKTFIILFIAAALLLPACAKTPSPDSVTKPTTLPEESAAPAQAGGDWTGYISSDSAISTEEPGQLDEELPEDDDSDAIQYGWMVAPQKKTPQPIQEPAPPATVRQIAENIQTAIVELMLSYPEFHGNENQIGTRSFVLYDLENNGIPLVVIHMNDYWEGGINDIYKYIDGKYVRLYTMDWQYSFYNDAKGRLVLYEGGNSYTSSKLSYSYVDLTADEFVLDTVYYDERHNGSGVYYNRISEVKLNWDEDNYYATDTNNDYTDPKILDESLIRIARIEDPDIREKVKRALDGRLAKIKADSKGILCANMEIVSCDIAMIEYEGVLYASAQDIIDSIGATLEFDEKSKTINYAWRNSYKATLHVDEPYSGEKWGMDEEYPDDPPRIINGVLMFPATFMFSEYFAHYIPELNMIDLTYARNY
jgi:hypothetical protein